MSNTDTSELSERELEILRLVATGASNKEIATTLFISSNTVKVHLRNIFSKIGAASRTEAAMYAVRAGLIQARPVSIASDEEPDRGEIETILTPLETIPDKASNASITAAAWFRWGGIGVILVLLVTLIGVVLGRGSGIQVGDNEPIPPTPSPRWQELAGMPTARSGLAAAAYENRIYAIGGDSAQGVTGVMERYDPETNAWVALSPKPLPVADAGAVVIGGQIYIPGGRQASGWPTDVLEIYDPRQDQWTQGAPLPIALSTYAMVAFEGRMYLFGGWDGGRYLDSVYVYDPSLDTWSERAAMPHARGFAGAVEADRKIFVLGGTDGTQVLSVNEFYQPDLGEVGQEPWVESDPLPAGRYAMGIASMADLIFIIGGTGGDETPLPPLEYSPQKRVWQQLQQPPIASWSNIGLVALGTQLYALGGKVGDTLSNNNLTYQAIYTIALPVAK